MPRKKMISREFKLTRVNVLILNTETAEPYNSDISLTGEYKDAEKALKVVKEMYKGTELVPAKIVSMTSELKLLGMYEEDFIKWAMVLDPKTRKPLPWSEIQEAEEEE